MGLKLSVKIGDVTNLSDARYAAGMGVDYIGFNIDTRSDNYVTAQKFNEIVNWISGVGIIGEIGSNPPDNLNEYTPFLIETNDYAQVKHESIVRINAKNLEIKTIKSHLITNNNILFFVLELAPQQIEHNISELSNLCKDHPIYLSSHFSETLLETITNQINPKGIEIKGGIEDQPGFKDYDGIADVLEWLEEDE